jgi:hypothetical protein
MGIGKIRGGGTFMRFGTSKTLMVLVGATTLIAVAIGSIAGADRPTANPTGAWKVAVSSTNAQVQPTGQTLKLKLNGTTLTGTLTYRSSAVVDGKSRMSESKAPKSRSISPILQPWETGQTRRITTEAR